MSLTRPLLRNDLVYHVVVTKVMDYILTLHTTKAARIQLNDVRARLGTGLHRYEITQGLQMEFDLSRDSDAFMYDYLLRYGHYEREVESVLTELITGDTTFVDVGANVGYFTLFSSRLAQTVYAFEPVPAVFTRLSRNVALNGLKNVRAFQCAVSKKRERLKIFESKISPGHDSTVKRFEHGRSILVDSLSLDEVIEPSARSVVMKVDVEGSEMDVLIGALGLIRSGRVSAIVLEWARWIYPNVAELRDRFALYCSLGDVEVLGDPLGRRKVRERHEIPDFCNLLIRVKR